MSDEIITPGQNPEDMPPEVLKQMQQEARIRLAKAQTFAKAFAERCKKEFGHLGTSDFLAILAATTCDLLAEALVLMDQHDVQSLDKSIPLFTQRIVLAIQARQDEADAKKIVVARNHPPSRN